MNADNKHADVENGEKNVKECCAENVPNGDIQQNTSEAEAQTRENVEENAQVLDGENLVENSENPAAECEVSKNVDECQELGKPVEEHLKELNDCSEVCSEPHIEKEENLEQTTIDGLKSQMQDILKHSCQSYFILLAQDTGLLKTLMKTSEKGMSVKAIADTAGLKERYVRELLSGLVVSGIGNVTDDGDMFWISKETAAVFSDPSMQEMLNYHSLMLFAFGSAFDDLSKCFRLHGPNGISPAKFPSYVDRRRVCFETQKHAMINWEDIKKALPESLSQKMAAGAIRCLDIGCGTGELVLLAAGQYPESKFEGVDLNKLSIIRADQQLRDLGISNAHFLEADASNLKAIAPNTYDLVTCINAMHEIPRPDFLLMEIHRILKRDGCLISVEPDLNTNVAKNITKHNALADYVFSLSCCLPKSMYFEGSWGLGCTVGKERMTAVLQDHDFSVEKTEPMSDNESVMFVARRKT